MADESTDTLADWIRRMMRMMAAVDPRQTDLEALLDERERLRSALNEALDEWESWHNDRHDDEPNPRIAELRGLAGEIPPGDRLRMQRLAELNVGEIERGPLTDAEAGERSNLRRALGRHVNPFVDLVHGRPDGGVDIEIDHPRGPIRWELPSERAEQLRDALDFIIVCYAAPRSCAR